MITPTLATLPQDLYPLVFRGLTKRDMVAIRATNKKLRQIAIPLIYPYFFGRVNPSFTPDQAALASLVNVFGKQPCDFKSFVIESLKNTPFGKVQETYDRRIALLENTTPTSILQLKALELGFYWTDLALTDYQNNKDIQKKEVTAHGKPLHERCMSLFATIGGFRIQEKIYQVVAHHIYRNVHGLESKNFGSLTILIVERSTLPCFQCPNFKVLISRQSAATTKIYENESHYRPGQYVNNIRIIEVIGGLEFHYDHVSDSNGSDRLVDQKLIQIAIEVCLQNNNIKELRIPFYDPDRPLFTAAGFIDTRSQDKLRSFRKDPRHKAFPPSSNERGFVKGAWILRGDLCEKNVMRSGDKLGSWEEVIAQEPILNPGAGVLPEFWAFRPNMTKG